MHLILALSRRAEAGLAVEHTQSRSKPSSIDSSYVKNLRVMSMFVCSAHHDYAFLTYEASDVRGALVIEPPSSEVTRNARSYYIVKCFSMVPMAHNIRSTASVEDFQARDGL